MAKGSTTDTVQEFKRIRNEILQGDIKPFYLLFGKEHYYIEELCRLLLEKTVPEEERDFGQLVFYGADTTAEQVVSAARQYPMMVSRQIVVLKEAQMMRRVEDIGVYFEGVMPTTVLVVCYKTVNDISKSGKNIDKRTAFYKQALKTGVVFESNQVQDYKMAKAIEGFAAEKGLSIDPDAAELLAEATGVNMEKVALEIGKLLKLLPEGSVRITAKDIEENVGMSRDYSAFELSKALSYKNPEKVFRIVKFLSESSKRFPLVVTMAALSSHFMKLLRFHALLQSGVQRREVLAQLGINPYFAGEYDTALRNYPLKSTIKVIALLKDYDQRSKSNRRGEASDGDLLTELVSKILAC